MILLICSKKKTLDDFEFANQVAKDLLIKLP